MTRRITTLYVTHLSEYYKNNHISMDELLKSFAAGSSKTSSRSVNCDLKLYFHKRYYNLTHTQTTRCSLVASTTHLWLVLLPPPGPCTLAYTHTHSLTKLTPTHIHTCTHAHTRRLYLYSLESSYREMKIRISIRIILSKAIVYPRGMGRQGKY